MFVSKRKYNETVNYLRDVIAKLNDDKDAMSTTIDRLKLENNKLEQVIVDMNEACKQVGELINKCEIDTPSIMKYKFFKELKKVVYEKGTHNV